MTEATTGAPAIRAARAADAAAIAEIYNHYVQLGTATFDTTPWTPQRAATLIASPRPEGWYVAQAAEGQIVGWVAARRYSDRAGYRHACETSIYVAPHDAGRGLGQQLYERLDAHCQQFGIRHAVARISAENPRSIEFHLRCGFEVVGIQKEIGRMHDRWVDVTILQKLHRSADASGE